MAEYVTSHDASIGKRGLVYIPQCIREMLPEGVRNMYASLEKRKAGNCVVLRTTSKSLFSVEVAISSVLFYGRQKTLKCRRKKEKSLQEFLEKHGTAERKTKLLMHICTTLPNHLLLGHAYGANNAL